MQRPKFAELAVAASGGALLELAWHADRGWYELHVARDYCAIAPREVWLWNGARVLVAALAITLIMPVRRRLASCIEQRRLRDRAIASLRILAAIALALVASDLLLRAHARSGVPVPAFPPTQPDAHLGWAHAPGTTATVVVDGRPIDYVFNAHGFRSASLDAPDPSAPSILFAGESLAEGVGIAWDQTFVAMVGKELHAQSVQSAVWGYGFDQAFMAMKSELATLHAPLAVVTIVLPQQLERSRSNLRPRLRLGSNDHLVFLPADDPPPAWWTSDPLRALFDRVVHPHDASAIDLARAIFRNTAREAEARGARALFVLTNWGVPPCMPDADGEAPLEHRLFDGLGLSSVRVDLDPRAVEQTTFHPDPAAHTQIADAIVRALRTWTR